MKFSLANIALYIEVLNRSRLSHVPRVGGKNTDIIELGRLGVLHSEGDFIDGNFVDVLVSLLLLGDFYFSPFSNRSRRRIEPSDVVIFSINRRGHLQSVRRMEEDARSPVSVFAIVSSSCEVKNGCPALVSVGCGVEEEGHQPLLTQGL